MPPPSDWPSWLWAIFIRTIGRARTATKTSREPGSLNAKPKMQRNALDESLGNPLPYRLVDGRGKAEIRAVLGNKTPWQCELDNISLKRNMVIILNLMSNR